MSWIVKDLWKELEDKKQEYEHLLVDVDRWLQAYWIINRIASEVGNRWGVTLQVNFPPGQSLSSVEGLGHRDLSLLVHRDRKKFQDVTENDLRTCFDQLKPLSFENVGFGHEGFKVKLQHGRIDCLPSGVHLWCELTPEVLSVLDWLFERAYQMRSGVSLHWKVPRHKVTGRIALWRRDLANQKTDTRNAIAHFLTVGPLCSN